MNSYLLYKNKNFDWDKQIPEHILTAFNDLEMDTIFNTMARDDIKIYESVRAVMAQMLTEPNEIEYRQAVLQDSINNPWIFENIQEILRHIEEEKERLNRQYGILKDFPSSMLSISISMIELFIRELRNLKSIISSRSYRFRSEGFLKLFRQIETELNEEFFREVELHLKRLQFKNGILVSTSIGTGLKAEDFKVNIEHLNKVKWINKFFNKDEDRYTVRIKEKSDLSARNLSDLREKILNNIANMLMQTVDHLSDFFEMFYQELSFYQGCYNLFKFLKESRLKTIYPIIDKNEDGIDFKNLYDVSLGIVKGDVVGNSCNTVDKEIIFITGANQGGKTTFLRSLGQAILMTQCGLFVGANFYRSKLYSDLYTYFRKEEDEDEESGKFDEELKRMDGIVTTIKPGSCLLMNEPFASTNEKEASEIGSNIIRALSDCKITIFCVTHLFSLTSKFIYMPEISTLFLRAEREENGERSFKLKPKIPLKTGYGVDLYRQIFGKIPE